MTDDAKIEQRLGERAESQEAAAEELEGLALEGLNSGEPIEPGPGYWEAKHRLLDARTA